MPTRLSDAIARRDVVLTAIIVAAMVYCTHRLERSIHGVTVQTVSLQMGIEDGVPTYLIDKPLRTDGSWLPPPKAPDPRPGWSGDSPRRPRDEVSGVLQGLSSPAKNPRP